MKSVKYTHQFLVKPCDATTLKYAIERACLLQDLLKNESLIKVVTGIKTLPSLPKFYHMIVRELQSPYPSIKRIGDIISQDVTMTAKILQFVNSEIYLSHPQAGKKLLVNIPRLEEIAEAISYQEELYDVRGFSSDRPKGQLIPLASRILKAVLDYDVLLATGRTPVNSVEAMRSRDGFYDIVLLCFRLSVKSVSKKLPLYTFGKGKHHGCFFITPRKV